MDWEKMEVGLIDKMKQENFAKQNRIGIMMYVATKMLVEQEKRNAVKEGREPKDRLPMPPPTKTPLPEPRNTRWTLAPEEWSLPYRVESSKAPQPSPAPLEKPETPEPAPPRPEGAPPPSPAPRTGEPGEARGEEIQNITPAMPIKIIKIPTNVTKELVEDENRIIDRFNELISQQMRPWIERMEDGISFMQKVFATANLSCRISGGSVPAFCRRIHDLEQMLITRFTSLSVSLASGIELSPLKARQNDFEVQVKGCFMSLLSFLKYEQSKRAREELQRDMVEKVIKEAAKAGTPVDPVELIKGAIKQSVSSVATGKEEWGEL